MKLRKDFNLAPRHKDFKKEVIELLKKQDPVSINSVSTQEARKAYNWNRQVAGCYQRSREFARLKISPFGILYGKIEPEHYVEDLVVRWFSSRFPMFIIMLESKRGVFVFTRDRNLILFDEPLTDILSKFEKISPKNQMLEELQDFNSDEYWEKYYSSQFIKSRKNRRYFQRNIPKMFHGWEGLKLEKKRFDGNNKLSDYD